MTERIVAWISKRALTVGIFSAEFEIAKKSPNIIVMVNNPLEVYCTEGVEWHRTKEEAIKRADFMRLKRIQDLKKELARLESLSFSD